MPSPAMPKRTALAFTALLVAACAQEAERYDSPPTPLDRGSQISERPVSIGFNGPRFAACPSFGEVVNIRAGEDSFLSVREAPANSAAEVAQLSLGAIVSMCQNTGGWVGIVYAPQDDPELDCGTSSSVPDVREYEGPCSSGWVRDDYLRLRTDRR